MSEINFDIAQKYSYAYVDNQYAKLAVAASGNAILADPLKWDYAQTHSYVKVDPASIGVTVPAGISDIYAKVLYIKGGGGGGGQGTYIAGNGISITNKQISVKIGNGLYFDSSNNLCTNPTCSPIPSCVRGTKASDNATTDDFCRDMVDPDKGNCKIGMMYMGTTYLWDNPLDGNHQSEILVKVIGGDESEHRYVLQLQLTSTNYHQRSWISMFNGTKNSGWMQFGDQNCPWFARLMTPVAGYDPSKAWEGVLLKPYRAASEQYVDDHVISYSYTNPISINNNNISLKIDSNTLVVDSSTNNLKINTNIIQEKLTAGNNIDISNNNISYKPYNEKIIDTTSSGSVSANILSGKKYTYTSQDITEFTITNVENQDFLSLITFKFADYALNPSINYPTSCMIIGDIPIFEPGNNYLIGIESNMITISEIIK